MIEKANSLLAELVGVKLHATSRAGNMECLKFGKINRASKKDGRITNVGEFGIHIQCPWHLRSNGKIIVASADLYEPADESQPFDEDFDWDKPNANRRDIILNVFLSKFQPTILACKTDYLGGLEINFDENISLVAFPDTSKTESELWRLIDNRVSPSKHLVRYINGFE